MESSKVDLTAQLPYRVPPDVYFLFSATFNILGGICVGICILLLPFLLPPQIWKGNRVFKWALMVITTPIGFNQIKSSFRFINRFGRLLVDENGIHHGSLFSKKRSILWGEIDQIISGTQDSFFYGTPLKGSLGKVNRSMGPYLMVITRKDGADPFVINIKPYTMRGMATFVHFLTAQAKTAKIDEKTLKMMQGIFPSVFFGEGKAYW